MTVILKDIITLTCLGPYLKQHLQKLHLLMCDYNPEQLNLVKCIVLVALVYSAIQTPA